MKIDDLGVPPFVETPIWFRTKDWLVYVGLR